jgi:hypothetical protein
VIDVKLVALFVLVALSIAMVANSVNEYLYKRPCKAPVQYSIGKIDPRFNISRSAVEQKLEIAAQTWSSAVKKKLFQRVPSGGISVNFIYDIRQELVERNIVLDKNERHIIAEHVRLLEESDAIEADKKALSKKESLIIQRGRQTKADFDWMNAENKKLSDRITKLNDEYNKLEQLSETHSKAIDAYNADLAIATAGRGGLRKGEYRGGLWNTNISVFYYTDTRDLQSTLAHEFGHALWLRHNDDVDAIMYMSDGNAVKPSARDLKDLEQVCTMDYVTFLMLY